MTNSTLRCPKGHEVQYSGVTWFPEHIKPPKWPIAIFKRQKDIFIYECLECLNPLTELKGRPYFEMDCIKDNHNDDASKMVAKCPKGHELNDYVCLECLKEKDKIRCQSECEHDWEPTKEKANSPYTIRVKCKKCPAYADYGKEIPLEFFRQNRTNQPTQKENCTNCTCIDKVIEALSVILKDKSGNSHEPSEINAYDLFKLKDKLKELKDK